MDLLTPKEIVAELDRHIVGQGDAKRAVALALRNRWRRKQAPEDLRDEITPKNILMIGPTGVGKTEVSRRLAKLANAPFLKVEATKFTEVGYVGRDVESIVRDLVEIAIHMTRERMRKEVVAKAEIAAEERVLDALVGESASKDTRQKFRTMLRQGELDDREIEIELQDASGGMPTMEIPGMPGAQMGMINLNDMLGKAFGSATKTKKMSVGDSYDVLVAEEGDKLLDDDVVVRTAIESVEQNGIVFLDEIDKICVRSDGRGGADVSRACCPATGSNESTTTPPRAAHAASSRAAKFREFAPTSTQISAPEGICRGSCKTCSSAKTRPRSSMRTAAPWPATSASTMWWRLPIPWMATNISGNEVLPLMPFLAPAGLRPL